MDIIAIAVALKKAISQTKNIIASHFVAGTNIEITDNPDGSQTISASGEVSATDEVARQAISDHEADVNNPHSVTKNQIGLGNVDNTSDADKPISTATQTALNDKQPTINSSNPLSSDSVDDTNSAHKFATAAELAQIATNTTNIGTLNTFKENTYLEKWNYATQCESIQDNTYITDIASYYIDNEAPYFVLNYVPIPEGAATVYVDCEGFEDKTSISYGFIWFKENKSVCSGADSHGIATSKTLTVPAQARYLAITFEYVNDDYTNKPKGYYYVTDKIVSERMDKVVINNESLNVLSAEDTTEALNSKQDKIDSTNKLSADLVDDTNTTNKFVTSAEKTTISKAVTTDDIGLGTDYFVYNGTRVYISATEPTGDIPVGSKGMGFCDATSTFKSGEKSGTLPLTVTADSNINYKIYGASGGVGVSTEDGYKLPIVSQPGVQGDEPVTETADIYIGDTPLLKGEYVDSVEQKIYRKIDVRTEIGLSVTQPYPTVNSQGVGRVSMEKTMSWETELTIEEAGFIYVKDITNADELILENVGKNGITKRETPAGDNPHTLNLTDSDGNGARLVGYAVVTDGTYETVLYTEEGKATYQQLVDEPGISHLYPGPDDVGEILEPVDPPVPLPKIPSFSGETVVSYDSETTPPENVSLTYGAWQSDLDDIDSRLMALEQAIANG